MFKDDSTVTKTSLAEYTKMKNNFGDSGKYDREEIVLINDKINIEQNREDYASHKKWAKAVFGTSFLKHLWWDKVFGATIIA